MTPDDHMTAAIQHFSHLHTFLGSSILKPNSKKTLTLDHAPYKLVFFTSSCLTAQISVSPHMTKAVVFSPAHGDSAYFASLPAFPTTNWLNQVGSSSGDHT